MTQVPQGPLSGFRLVEFSGVGPSPFGVMLLADLGMEVIRIERPTGRPTHVPIISRGRGALTLDLKVAGDRDRAIALIEVADVLVEGFRPGVMERSRLGPEEMCARNAGLVYARMTGWGQRGAMAPLAGHDINYAALSGMLGVLGAPDALPVAPLNLLGDYAGGGLYLALGVAAALAERAHSGRGQVLDVAIVDGCASLLAPIMGLIAAGLMPEGPQRSIISGTKPYYRTYRCADGKAISVGPLEERFRRLFAERLGLDLAAIDGPAGIETLERLFSARTRDEWVALFHDIDACVAPVLSLDEAPHHPHLIDRETFRTHDGLQQPSVAPRFSRTPGGIAGDEDGDVRARRWLESGR